MISLYEFDDCFGTTPDPEVRLMGSSDDDNAFVSKYVP